MKCLYVNCKNTIPEDRHKSAKYCCPECYYKAKKERSIKRYALLKAPADELNRCERILEYFYGIAKMGKTISITDLEIRNFNFAISSNEYLNENKNMFKIIGQYGYFIEPDRNLLIWKFN